MFRFREITPDLVLTTVNKTKSCDSIDYYDLSSNLIKKIIHTIVKPLTLRMNKCLNEEYFPEKLKITRVVPVFKKGKQDSPSGYRPISIIPIFAKIFEVVICFQLCQYFEDEHLLIIF